VARETATWFSEVNKIILSILNGLWLKLSTETFLYVIFIIVYDAVSFSEYVASNGRVEEQQPAMNLKGSRRHVIEIPPSHFLRMFEIQGC
jgi:hypothetical protein